MPTYSHYAQERETVKRRAADDKRRAALHRQFDLQAQDVTMKYERPSFIVVTASEAYRKGWDETFNHKPTENESPVVIPKGATGNETDSRI